jgi:hypothetical protein
VAISDRRVCDQTEGVRGLAVEEAVLEELGKTGTHARQLAPGANGLDLDDVPLSFGVASPQIDRSGNLGHLGPAPSGQPLVQGGDKIMVILPRFLGQSSGL